MLVFIAQLLACALPLVLLVLFMHRMRIELETVKGRIHAATLDIEEVSAHVATLSKSAGKVEQQALAQANTALNAAVKEFTELREWVGHAVAERAAETRSLGKAVDTVARTLNTALQPDSTATNQAE